MTTLSISPSGVTCTSTAGHQQHPLPPGKIKRIVRGWEPHHSIRGHVIGGLSHAPMAGDRMDSLKNNRIQLPCPPGAPPRMKIGRRYSVPGQYVRMRSSGLVVRSCSDWCPEPVTQLDLDTCRHHPLSPASPGKPSTQGSLSRSGYPASPLRVRR